jgi:hypothetical protein
MPRLTEFDPIKSWSNPRLSPADTGG